MAKYLAIYTHRHGTDLLHFASEKKLDDLDADEVAKRLKIDWEPDRDEDMEFFELSSFDFPGIDPKPRKKKGEEQEKDFGEIVAELIAHGLNNEEIFEQLVNGYGYMHKAPEYLIGLIRQHMEDTPPQEDLTAYLEMACIALDRDDVRDQIADGMDLSDKEITRLIGQLNKFLEKKHG